MDMLVVIIMLVLFIFLMVFVFSTALLTPMIGKRNLIFVLSVGFAVGLVGGTFFIAPLYDDMPEMARSVFTFSSSSPEVININMSTDNDVNAFMEEIRKLNGVKKVECKQITLRTAPFDLTYWTESLSQRIPIVDSDVQEVQVPTNDSFVLVLNENNDPSQVVKNVDEWLDLVGGMDVYTHTAQISITVDASQVGAVSQQLPQDKVVIADITGPVEDQITAFKTNLPDRTAIIILCGFIGLMVGAVGLFIDSISQLWNKIRLWLDLRKRKLK